MTDITTINPPKSLTRLHAERATTELYLAFAAALLELHKTIKASGETAPIWLLDITTDVLAMRDRYDRPTLTLKGNRRNS